MPDFYHIDETAAARLRELANHVRVTLITAGIPAFDSESPSEAGGARIEVDTGDDAAGGIYVSWRFPRKLADEIGNHLLSDQLSHPTIEYSGQVRIAMRDAIVAILTAAGFSAELSADDMRPLAVSISC